MYPLIDETKNSSSPTKILLGVILVVATIGTTLASVLTINTNNRVTFGQGMYQIKACDGWIDISFDKTSTDDGVGPPGSKVQAVSAVNIDGFNSRACKNTNFKIKLYKSTAPETPLDLYREAHLPNPVSTQVWLSVDNDGLVTLLDTRSVNLGEYGDSAIALVFDTEIGRYTAYFFTPLAPASNVDIYTVESGPNRA
jgi:hypothetical protein